MLSGQLGAAPADAQGPGTQMKNGVGAEILKKKKGISKLKQCLTGRKGYMFQLADLQ